MDPCSRHIVWNLLKNRKANRVTVFSTHFMDEADILAGESCRHPLGTAPGTQSLRGSHVIEKKVMLL